MPIITQPARAEFPDFVGEIRGLDTSVPFDQELAAKVRAAMDHFGVCYVRNFPMTDDQQVAFSRLFGELEIASRFGSPKARIKTAELFDVSNMDEEERILEDNDRRRLYRLANALWHTDSSFQPGGASYSLLRACIVPSHGANTEFLDTRAAYDSLPDAMKARLEGLVVEHSTGHSRSLLGYALDEREQTLRKPTLQYLVQTHPSSGRKCLYLASHASHIVGMDVAEGRALLAELTEHVVRTPGLYSHEWKVGDLLIWDNRCTMHRATPFDEFAEKRDLRRSTVVGDLPLVLA